MTGRWSCLVLAFGCGSAPVVPDPCACEAAHAEGSDMSNASDTSSPDTSSPATSSPDTSSPATPSSDTPSSATPSSATPSPDTPSPDFVTNVELTAPDESDVLGYRVAVYETPSARMAPRDEDRGDDYDAGLLLGARVVRDDAGIAIAVSGSGTTTTSTPVTTTPLVAWIFDPDGRFVAAELLDTARSWPPGYVAVVVTEAEATRRALGPGWSIAIEP